MRYRRVKRDAVQKPITEALLAVGCSVVDLAMVGGGVGDLLVGVRGHNLLFECKDPARRNEKFSGTRLATEERQATFRANWKGQQAVVYSVDEALYQVSCV